jgi:hypothetical protein
MNHRRLHQRCLTLALLGCFATAGCGSSQTGGRARGVTAGVLGGLAVLAGAGAVAASRISEDKEKKLADDLAARQLTGAEYADRDAEGKRWNRAARGAVFASGLALVGMILVWESSLSAGHQYGPAETPSSPRLIPGAAPASPPSASLLPGRIPSAHGPDRTWAHRSTSAR